MAIRQKQVKDQVIVITGASSGIGLATAKEAAARGARVVLNSRDSVDISRAVEEIREDGGEAAMHVGDVADRAAMEGLADTAIGRRMSKALSMSRSAAISLCEATTRDASTRRACTRRLPSILMPRSQASRHSASGWRSL